MGTFTICFPCMYVMCYYYFTKFILPCLIGKSGGILIRKRCIKDIVQFYGDSTPYKMSPSYFILRLDKLCDTMIINSATLWLAESIKFYELVYYSLSYKRRCFYFAKVLYLVIFNDKGCRVVYCDCCGGFLRAGLMLVGGCVLCLRGGEKEGELLFFMCCYVWSCWMNCFV